MSVQYDYLLKARVHKWFSHVEFPPKGNFIMFKEWCVCDVGLASPIKPIGRGFFLCFYCKRHKH